MVACAGDYLRIWQLKENGTHLIKLLNNVRAHCITFAETCLPSRSTHCVTCSTVVWLITAPI